MIMCDPYTRKPRGFGFITYDTTLAVDRACITKFHELNGKRVEVKRAIPQERMATDDPHGAAAADPRVMAAINGFLPGSALAAMGGAMGGAHAMVGGRGGMMGGRGGVGGRSGGMGGVGAMMAQMGAASAETQALDAALSSANSVLAQAAMAEPSPTIASTDKNIPTGILNAFSNPSNFSSATAALANGMRAGYGNNGPDGAADQPGGGQQPPAGDTTAAYQAQQNMLNAQQQQQFQHTLLLLLLLLLRHALPPAVPLPLRRAPPRTATSCSRWRSSRPPSRSSTSPRQPPLWLPAAMGRRRSP